MLNAKENYLLLFCFKNQLCNVIISGSSFFEDEKGINDYWGEFNLENVDYQLQIYHGDRTVAIFLKDTSTPIYHTNFVMINSI